MNAEYDWSVFDGTDAKKCEALLARIIADKTRELCGMKAQLKQKLESQFQSPAETLGSCWSKMVGAIMRPHAEAASRLQACEDKIHVWIEAQLQRGQGVLDLCQAKIRKAENRCKDKAKARENAPEKPPAVTPVPIEAPSLPPEPFPAVPTPEELAGLLIPFPDNSGAIDLAQLPAELWDHKNPQRLWLSLEPTPLSRVQASTLRFDGQQVTPAGTVFFNVGMPMSLDDMASLLRAFGLPEGSYLALEQEEAWKLNSEAFGGLLTGQLWDFYGIPHPAVLPTIAAGLVMKGGEGLDIDCDQAEPVVEDKQVLQRFPNPLDLLPPELQPRMPQLPQLPPAVQQFVPQFPQLRIPTHAEMCALLDPVYAVLGVPPQLRVPCVSLAQGRAALLAMMGQDEVNR